jgi:hypothetical protein
MKKFSEYCAERDDMDDPEVVEAFDLARARVSGAKDVSPIEPKSIMDFLKSVGKTAAIVLTPYAWWWAAKKLSDAGGIAAGKEKAEELLRMAKKTIKREKILRKLKEKDPQENDE